MVKRVRLICSLASFACLSCGCWMICPAYGVIMAGVCGTIICEVGVLVGKVKRGRDAV